MNGWMALDRFLHTDPRDVGCAEAMDMLHVYAVPPHGGRGRPRGQGDRLDRVREVLTPSRGFRAAAWRSRRLTASGRWQRSRYRSGRCAAAVDSQDRAVKKAVPRGGRSR
jgi:hypothetical protein